MSWQSLMMESRESTPAKTLECSREAKQRFFLISWLKLKVQRCSTQGRVYFKNGVGSLN